MLSHKTDTNNCIEHIGIENINVDY